MFNIAVAQSGGPTAAINASLTGVFSGAELCPDIDEIYGAENGIEGILNDRLLNLRNILMDEHDKELLMKTPSTILGSCRFKLKDFEQDEESYLKILDTFNKHNIKAFFYIGGNDSMDTVMKLDRYFTAQGIDIKVIGVPKTIDNDVTETDHTPGFGSAAKYVATSLQEIIRDCRVYSIPSVTIVEIMGRDAGWLAASSCVLRANGEPAPHMIYLPENDFSPEKFLEDVKQAQLRYKAVIVAVSEGVKCDFATDDDAAVDAFGHVMLGGIGKKLEKFVAANIGCKVRSIELNVMQRCSSHIASLTDITEAERIGREAVAAAIERGESGVMMSFKRISNNPYRCEIVTADISKIANQEKKFPKEWINPEGNNVTIDALNYFLPLIQGEPVIEYRNGIPVHFRLNQ
ncbi:MAG: 6-phosphofructokinase [Oscillospiraceae bacterium]|nr:6-phosphofructokinase [Oscillospiraceae bacterium]